MAVQYPLDSEQSLATRIFRIETSPINMEPLRARLQAIMDQIDAHIPPSTEDPVLIERRRCAVAALSAVTFHYMSEGTVAAAVSAILHPPIEGGPS